MLHGVDDEHFGKSCSSITTICPACRCYAPSVRFDAWTPPATGSATCRKRTGVLV